MKNIFLLPTDQPSKLGYISESKTYHLYNNDIFLDELANAINIYITSDEDIKEGNWYLDTTVNVIFKNDKLFLNGTGYKKIILTTDPTLIVDGVQSIDDNFLKWFVKNSSCDFVEVELECFYQGKCVKERCLTYCCDEKQYKIIIPQEEPKQESHICKYCNAETTQPDDECYAKPKQETLEEAAKRMYSEEELKQAFRDGQSNMHYSDIFGLDSSLTEQQWFENFKKK